MGVYVYGEVVVVVGVAYVRSCAHIHQWNVKGKKEGASPLFPGASLFSVLSPLCCSVGLFV